MMRRNSWYGENVFRGRAEDGSGELRPPSGRRIRLEGEVYPSRFPRRERRSIPSVPGWVLIGSLLAGGAVSADAQVVLYPVPPGLTASNQYEVNVWKDGAWQPSYVNFDTARTSGSGSGDEAGKTFSWTTFETAGPVVIRVRRLEGGFNTATFRPSRHGIVGRTIGGDTIEFTIHPGQKVSVEFDTEIKDWCYTGAPYGLPCIRDAMMVFADPLKTAAAIDGVPASDIYHVTPGTYQTNVVVSGSGGATAGKCTLGNAGGKKVVVFGPGVYDIGYWQVPNNIEQIHFEGGAVVFGAVDVIPQGRTPFYDLPTIYQIYRNGWGSETLKLPNVKVSDAGNYRVVVSNLAGTATSSNAALTVVAAGRNLLVNPGFEYGLTAWEEYNGGRADIAAVPEPTHTGSGAAKVHNRSSKWTGIEQDITGILQTHGQGPYEYSAWARTETGTLNAYVTIRIVDAQGTRWFPATGLPINTGDWQPSSTIRSLTWNGLIEAFIYFETSSTETDSFFVDDFSLAEVGAQPRLRLLSAVSQSPSNAVHGRVTNLLGTGPATVYSSSNLVDWAEVETRPATAGSWDFTDTVPGITSQRFYKAEERR